jgi:phosphate-selective porin OprO/OprP
MLLVLVASVRSVAADEPASRPADPPAAPTSNTVSRELTRGEMQRQLDLLQRQLEVLTTSIGDKQPDEKQQQTLTDLRRQIDDLQSRLDAATAAQKQKVEAAGHGFKARWLRVRESLRDFTRYDVKDGMFRLRFGIRLQLDLTAGSASAALRQQAGSIDDGLSFRRARIYSEGRLFRQLDFKFEYDFAADRGLKDAYVEGGKYLKYVRWRIGHFKEPVSLARQTSSNDLGFLEWALPVPVLAPGRNWGLMIRHAELRQRMTWALSVTTHGQTTDDNRSASHLSVAMRATGLPMYRDKGRRLVHLGASYNVRNPKSDFAFKARPEARFAPFMADTGPISADGYAGLGLEAAVVAGPFWAQAEYLRADVDSSQAGDPVFDGAYLEVGYFLTGESRAYDPTQGAFFRLTPKRLFHGGNPFTRHGDCGALEVTARYSGLDLNDALVSGGEMTNLSLGMNWYTSQTSRFMLNYVRSELHDVGAANIVLVRYQFNP